MKMIDRLCCDFGEYLCTIPMPINSKVQYIDVCIADIVAALNAANITTVASCCGHNKINGNIILEDGRCLVIKKFKEEDFIMKNVLYLCDDAGWEAIYLDGKLITQGNDILTDGISFLQLAERYEFKSSDITIKVLTNEDSIYVNDGGGFPESLVELSGDY